MLVQWLLSNLYNLLTMNHTVDATNKPLGRLASEIAVLLRGKDKATFERHIDPKVAVAVVNAKDLKLTGTKLNTKLYHRYSGYPGGMKERTAAEVITKKGYGELIKKAVRGMLPNNKLRPLMLKRLTIND